MTYLILGSNSFSGSSFINYVLNNTNSKIVAVSRSNEYDKSLLTYKNNKEYFRVDFYEFDLNKNLDEIVSIIADNKIECIINFAAQGMVAQSWNNPSEWFNTNVLSLVALLDKIYKFDFIKKFVQISTPEVYGECNNIKETMNFAPSTPYASSKASADLVLYTYYKTHGFPVNFTRASNVYGPYQQLYRIIPKTILSIRKGIKLPLHGGGKAIRSFIHIDDVAKATFVIANEAKSGNIYHLSDNKTISIYDLVKIISEELNVQIKDYVEITSDRIGTDALYLMNNEKIYDEFGFTPKIKFRDGIKSVVDWVDDNFEKLINYPDYYIHKK